MNIVYDLILNFSKLGCFREFYEWDKMDDMLIIERIPIIRVKQNQLIDMFNSNIRVDKSFLKCIYRKTYTEFGIIDYCCLFTDLSRVLALKFNENGEVEEQSSLLIDEESAVIEENNDLKDDNFTYDIIESFSDNSFITRKEKKIREYLIYEIKKLYDLKMYDGIEYLYYEMFLETSSIQEMYSILLDNVKYSFDDKTYKLYNIIKMISLKVSS